MLLFLLFFLPLPTLSLGFFCSPNQFETFLGNCRTKWRQMDQKIFYILYYHQTNFSSHSGTCTTFLIANIGVFRFYDVLDTFTNNLYTTRISIEEKNVTISKGHLDVVFRVTDLAKTYPPCMRIIVKETSLPKLKIGTLFLVAYTGGSLGREGDHAVIIPDLNISKVSKIGTWTVL